MNVCVTIKQKKAVLDRQKRNSKNKDKKTRKAKATISSKAKKGKKKSTSLYSAEGKLTADDIDWGLDYLLIAENWIMVVEPIKRVTVKTVSLNSEEGTNNETE